MRSKRGDSQDSTRERILQAALLEVESGGMTTISMDAVARSAGLGRATLYRHFGDRDALLAGLVEWEVRRFWSAVSMATSVDQGLEERLISGLMVGHSKLESHALLGALLAREAEVLLPLLEQADAKVHDALCAEIRRMLCSEPTESLRPGIDMDEAARYIALLARSVIASPAGWDLTDREVVRRLVRTQFLGGVLNR